jgi:FkbM family methyltransferase
MNKTSKQVLRFSQSRLFKQLTKSSPITLVDIGARGGIHQRWNLVSRDIRVLGFEPDMEECKKLNEKSGKNHIYFPIALYNRSGTIKMNVVQSAASSSIYLPNFSLWNRFPNSHELKVIKSIQVNCDTLDNVLKSNGIQDVDFLKVDTQGSELQVLQGAKNALQNFIFGIDVEVEFSELYKEQPLFSDVDEYLRKSGFVFFDFVGKLGRVKRNKFSENVSKGQVLWAHALYFKDFLLDKNIHSNYLNFEKTIKTIAIAEIYGFSDFALELLDFYNSKKIIDIDVYKDIKNMLIKNKLSPEYRLLANVRSMIGSYLKERMSSIYNLIKKRL